MKRLTVLPWTCQRSGDCCQGPDLVMTKGEAAVLNGLADKASGPLVWHRHADPAFTILHGTPCPFLKLESVDQIDRFEPTVRTFCAVYQSRPMNCRRFACYRPDTSTEPLERDGSPLGCANATDRFRHSPGVQADYKAIEAAAQAWGWAHGWPT